MLGTLWLIPILPLAGAVLCLLLGLRGARKAVVTAVGVGSAGLATVATFVALWQYLHQAEPVLVERYFTWISAGRFTVSASFQLDALSAIMVAFVTFVGFLIHLYSVGYMHHEPDTAYGRYFAYLNLFMFVDADAGARRQPAGAVRRLGGRRALLVPADRLLVRRRTGAPRPARRPSSSTASATSASCSGCSSHSRPSARSSSARCSALRRPNRQLYAGTATAHRPAPVRRRDGQVGPDPALRLAARRHGRPDPGLGPDPRRHHGHRRRLHGRPMQRVLPAQPGGDARGRRSSAALTACSRRPSVWPRTTSRRCWPTRRSPSSATCSSACGRRAPSSAAIFHVVTHAFFKACCSSAPDR